MKRSHGEGTYYALPNGGWRFRILIDGRRVSGSGRTKGEAKRSALDRAKVIGTVPDARAMTLDHLVTTWVQLGHTEVGLRSTTFDQYRALVTKHLLPTLGRKRLDTITARHIGAAIDSMVGAASTKRSTYAALVRVLDHAVDRGYLSRNVARDVKRPRATEPAERACTPEEARSILRAAQGHRFEVAAWLSYGCGLRRGEILGLRWSDIDLDASRLTVTGNVTRSSSGLVRGSPKTRRGLRTVPFGPEVGAALREHRSRQVAQRLAADVWEDPDLVLANEVGSLVEPRALSRAFEQWARTAGVRDTGTHLGRHFAATVMLSSGRASVADVAAVLGHDPAVLLNTYAGAASEGQRAASAALGSVLSPVTGT